MKFVLRYRDFGIIFELVGSLGKEVGLVGVERFVLRRSLVEGGIGDGRVGFLGFFFLESGDNGFFYDEFNIIEREVLDNVLDLDDINLVIRDRVDLIEILVGVGSDDGGDELGEIES